MVFFLGGGAKHKFCIVSAYNKAGHIRQILYNGEISADWLILVPFVHNIL